MELRWTGRETPAYDVKGVQTHTHKERERERTTNQTANSPRSTEGSLNTIKLSQHSSFSQASERFVYFYTTFI
ncbi:uncharacterized [Lates japonicus]